MSEDRSVYSIDDCTINVCSKAPAGWYCSRMEGHDGPCAAHPKAPDLSVGVTADILAARWVRPVEYTKASLEIAQAIRDAEERGRVQEREECAKIADKEITAMVGFDAPRVFETTWRRCARTIAGYIRACSTAPKHETATVGTEPVSHYERLPAEREGR